MLTTVAGASAAPTVTTPGPATTAAPTISAAPQAMTCLLRSPQITGGEYLRVG